MTGSQKRIRDYGIIVGDLPTGTTNRITDVKGVKVGHCTINNHTNHTGQNISLECRGWYGYDLLWPQRRDRFRFKSHYH